MLNPGKFDINAGTVILEAFKVASILNICP